MKKPHTYRLKTVQDAFLFLPESDQEALIGIHRAEAYDMNDTVQSRIAFLLEGEKQESSETVMIAGVLMDRHDLGAPTTKDAEGNPCISVISDGDKAMENIPQATSYVFRDFGLFRKAYPHYSGLTENEARERNVFPATVWAYNKLARAVELEYLKKRGLTFDEYKTIHESFGKDTNALMAEMNGVFAGYHDTDACGFCGVGDGVVLAVSSKQPNGKTGYICLFRDSRNMFCN